MSEQAAAPLYPKTILFSLSEQDHYNLRLYALEHKTSVRQLLRDAVTEILKKGGKSKS